MPARDWRHVVTPAEEGLRLDTVLASRLPAVTGGEISRAAIRRLVMAGAVRVGPAAVRRPGLPLIAGTLIAARVDPGRLIPADQSSVFQLTSADVLFADDVLLAIAKPAGIPTHAGADARRPDMVTVARRYLASRAAPAAPYVGVHQRLDRETSGVLLFAIDERANAGLARAFEDRAVVKVYHAITVPARQALPAEWTVEARLAPHGTGRMSRMAVDAGGQEARTAFRLLERLAHGLLVEARPQTGRRHQVRAHLAHVHLPILGDTRYGAPAAGPSRASRVMLHCTRLELPHPLTGRTLVIECPWPDDFRRAARRAHVQRRTRRGA